MSQKFGRYIIKGTLGRGAMGMVYLALDPILDRLSAIKVMNTGGELDEGLRTRFFREAKSAARLRHPNIIAIYEMGEEEKRPFIAMEYVEGEDLKSLIEKRTFIPLEQKIRILVQVCEALSYAHQQGVIHRDIKPANVRIAQDGEVRILDFGLARLGSSDITRTGMLMGTPYYMSPEQVRGVRDLDGRSDLFSAAVLLYELLTYARPFEAESSTEVCLKIVSEPHTSLASVLPKVDADLEAIIDRALSKNRDARHDDCQDLARALKEYALTVPQRLKGLESEVARLEKEWKSCCDASQHLVQLGIFEESLVAPPTPIPSPAIDPEETTVYNFSLEASQRDLGSLLLLHARLHSRLEEIRQRLRAATPLQQLFERGQRQFEQEDFQECLKTLTEILEMAPENVRALDLQRQCQRLLEERRLEEERRARLRQAVALASEALEQGNLAQCIQSASRALQIDPGNNQGQGLKQQASDALVRRRKVAELLAAARGFHKAQDYQSACQVCAEALALDPGHAEILVIQQQAQQIFDRQNQIREWLHQAQEKLRAGDYLAVLGITDQLLTLEPDLPRALEMQQQAAEGVERQLKLEELVAVARGCERAGDFEECLRVCDQALQINPENPEILDLSKRASQTASKQRRVAELLSRARQEIEHKEFGLAAETSREAAGLDPANQTAQEMLQSAETGFRRQQRVAELLVLAESHQAQRNFQGCLDATDEALLLDPLHQGHLSVRRLALDSLDRVRQFEQHLEAAQQCDEDGDYTRALDHLQRALQLDDSNPVAVELKKRVADKLDRHNRLSACLEAARQHLQSENYAEALESAQHALQLDAANEEARGLGARATEALVRLEEENRLLAQARRHFEKQQYEMAIEGAEELLRLNPHHAGARALKQEAIDTQEQRQRFEACLVAARNHAKSQDYAACLAAANEALEIEPQHAELRRLQEKTMQAIDKEQAIAAGLERCRQYLATEDYASALEAADEVLRLEPKQKGGLALQRQAAAELENQQRFEELLVQARNHSKTQDHAACLKAADEALAFRPEHPEFLKLRNKSFQALERLRTIEAGLARARQALSDERFQESQELVQKLLAFEPQHPEALKLARAAAEGWQRQQRVEQFVAEARQNLEQHKYSAGLRAAQEGLNLKKSHAVLLELHKTLRQAVDREETLARLIEKAQEQLNVRDYAGTLETCDQCLELQADHSEAWKLHQAASDGLDRRQRVEEFQATATGYYTAKDYDACLKSVQEALSLEPEIVYLQTLQRDALQALQREQHLEALLRNAEQRFQERRFADALGLLDELLSADASHAGAARLKDKVSREWRKAQQVDRLLTEAKNHASQDQWEASEKKAQEGLKLTPGHADLLQVQDRAHRELDKLKRVAELVKKSRAAFEAQRFEDVLPLTEQLLQVDTGHQEAADLRARALASLERLRQIRALLQAAQEHKAASEPGPALQKADNGLQLDPRNIELLSIQRWAAEALEHQRQVNALLEEAKRQASEGDWEFSRKKAQEGLKLAPGHAELQQLLDRAQRELETRKRISELLRHCRAFLQEGQFEKALPLASQVLELAPGHSEASDLRDKASGALELRRQIRELLEASESHERAGQLELALEKAHAGLKLEPRNSQFLSIQSRTSTALEHQHRVSVLLGEARQQLDGHRYEVCLQACEALLKLEPEHREGQDLKQAATLALERLRQLTQCLTQARAKAKSELWEECLKLATEGLKLDSTHAELAELASRASEILDKRRSVEELLDSGRSQFGRGEHEAAIKSAERALQLAPDNAEASQLRQQAQSALLLRRKKEQVAALLAEARKHEHSGDVEACYRAASEGLNLEPEHAELKALREISARILETRRQVQILLERARQQWQAEDFVRVVETAMSILNLDPENGKAAEFKLKAEQEIDRQRRFNELLTQAKRADKEKDYENCLLAAEEGLVLDSAHPELQRLQSRSRQMLDQIRRFSQLSQEARAEFEAKNYAAALKALESALKLDGSNTEAAQLRQQAQEAWDREKRLESLLGDAQRQLKAGQFEACLKSTNRGLELESGHSGFKDLANEAQRQIELRRQVDEALKRATQHFEKNEHQAAIEAYEVVLKLAPGQAEATEGRRRAGEALQRQQRLEECLARAQSAFDAKDFMESQKAAQEGLRLEPGHPTLQGLAKQAAEIIERIRRVQQLWKEASDSRQKGDLPACLRSLDLLLELEPESVAARELRPQVTEALEKQRRVAGLLAEAASLEKSGDLEACQRLAEQALQIDPQHSQAQQFQQRISATLGRRRQIENVLKQALQRFTDEDDEGALKAVEELLRLDPSHARAQEIQTLASQRWQHRKRVEELLKKARKAFEARDPENCLRAAEQGLQLEPDHPEFKRLEAESRRQVERDRKVRELASECQSQLGSGAFEESILAATSLESLDPGNTIAIETRQRANDAIERRRRVENLLARALEVSTNGDFEACQKICGEALTLDPSNTELLELREKALSVLESRRREEEKRKRVQELLASAKKSLQGGRLRAATRHLTALLKLDATHAEARRLLAEAEAHLAVARSKRLRLAGRAAAVVLAVSLVGSGIWYAMQKLTPTPATPPVQIGSDPAPAKPQLPKSKPASPPPEKQTPAEDPEIARLLETSRNFLREKKYTEAAEAAEKLLARSLNHSEGARIQQEARKNLEKIEDGLRQARTLLDRGQYAQVASALGGVLAVDANHPEALQLMTQVDKYARTLAQDARKQMQEIKQRAGQARASSLAQTQYQTATLIETEAVRLFDRKRFGEAAGRFYEASEGYVLAEAAARKAADVARETAAREKAAKDNEQALKTAQQQAEERQRQLALQKGQAQTALTEYQKTLSRASKTNAERLAPEAFQQAMSLAMRAQDRFNQGNYAGAQQDFEEASRHAGRAAATAEEASRETQSEAARKTLEATQREQDRQAASAALRLYEEALETRDIDALKRIWPGISREVENTWRNSFKFYKSLQVDLQPLTEVRISNGVAVVSYRRVQQLTTTGDGKKLSSESVATFKLRKIRDSWVIDTIEETRR